ncbi:MAG: Mu transposase C-terminal domain-containing protein [Mesorhizobium sp.]
MNPALISRAERAYIFGRHDRLVIDGQSYRVERKVRDSHVLQPVTGDLIAEDIFVVKTDSEINSLLRSKRIRIDEGYYSKALSILRVRCDDSDLSDLSEEQMRTLSWKKEWCVRFLDAAASVDGRWRPNRVLPDFERFIDENRDRMDRWYFDTFGERRRPGRRQRGEARKAFDYPSASTLRGWVGKFIQGHCRLDSLRPYHSNCGNRNQLDARAAALIAVEVQKFASLLQPAMSDICENVDLALYDINKTLPAHQQVYASHNAVRRRIHRLDPFMVDAGRKGSDYALRKYTPVGRGLQITTALGRVEMDDWEVDLHTLVEKSSVWKALSLKQRQRVPRVRMTLTAGIDCASRCIVGFNLTLHSPSTASTKPALRSIMIDKTELAAAAGAKASWHMRGRPRHVVTDGGPAFRDEFNMAAMRVNIARDVPEQDPRKRGTIEAFFRFMKRLCRYFAGRAFANVVEKGDYPSELLASLTVGEFYKTVILFIVDNYHLRPHRGLEGRTPYAKWEALAKAGLPPSPSDEQLAVAFGLWRKARAVTRHGVDFVGISYNSPELGLLHGLVGKNKIDMIVEPEDLGYVYILIPERMRGRIKNVSKDTHFLIVPSVDGTGKGKTLVSVLMARRDVREFLRAEEEKGKPIRIESHRHLLDLADSVTKRASIPTHVITSKTMDTLERQLNFSAKAGLGSVQYASQESGEDGLGEVVALSSRRRASSDAPSSSSQLDDGNSRASPTPFGGSMNLYEGEDE